MSTRSHKWRFRSPSVRIASMLGTAVALIAVVGAPSKWY
jgi:hypothetical protein